MIYIQAVRNSSVSKFERARHFYYNFMRPVQRYGNNHIKNQIETVFLYSNSHFVATDVATKKSTLLINPVHSHSYENIYD